jgi:hypothetical protein
MLVEFGAEIEKKVLICIDFFFLCFLVIRTCTSCGKVLEDQFYSEEPTFFKNSAGQVMVAC